MPHFTLSLQHLPCDGEAYEFGKEEKKNKEGQGVLAVD